MPATTAMTHENRPIRFGRKPRSHDPRFPHWSALTSGRVLPPPPPSVDWAKKASPNWGMMKNDSLGDCTCAGAYHAMQLWSSLGRSMEITEPDTMVLLAYEEFCGYRPNDPSTDQGGNEQQVLARWHKTGVPIIEGTHGNKLGRSKIITSIEVDKRQHDDVKNAINSCGCVYIGFVCPASWDRGPIPTTWSDTQPNNKEGHCVILTGYDDHLLNVVSWGSGAYRMTWQFFDALVDEVYAIAHPWFIDATGHTPLGMDLAQLQSTMQAFA